MSISMPFDLASLSFIRYRFAPAPRRGGLVTALLLSVTLISPPTWADEEFINEMTGYINLARSMSSALSQQELAVFFAIEAIVEIYEQRDEVAEAVAHLERVIERYPENVAVRNIVRFKLQDLYRHLKMPGKALDQLDLIISESRRLPVGSQGVEQSSSPL